MMVTPLENCSTYFLAELLTSARFLWIQFDSQKPVEVIQIAQRRKELPRSAHPTPPSAVHSACASSKRKHSLVSNDQSPLPTLLHLIHLDHWPVSPLDLLQHQLVNLQCVLARLLHEARIRYASDFGCALARLGRWGRGERALRDEVTSELLGDGR